jgi:hypothetical protein
MTADLKHLTETWNGAWLEKDVAVYFAISRGDQMSEISEGGNRAED